jgi:hypothetical protein
VDEHFSLVGEAVGRIDAMLAMSQFDPLTQPCRLISLGVTLVSPHDVYVSVSRFSGRYNGVPSSTQDGANCARTEAPFSSRSAQS